MNVCCRFSQVIPSLKEQRSCMSTKIFDLRPKLVTKMGSYHIILVGVFLIFKSVDSGIPLQRSPPFIALAGDPTWSSNSTNASVQLYAPYITYLCEGGYYGHGAYADSCDEALRSMAIALGPPMQQLTWGDRTTGHYDIPLPQRWFSCQCSPRVITVIYQSTYS